MSNEEEKYKKLRESLRSLPKIKAKNDFEARLYRKIREHDTRRHIYQPEKENNFINMLANLFKPSLVPAIGLTIVLLAAIVVYFAYFNELTKDRKSPAELTNTEKKDEFIIYVKKDGDRVLDETARDITSADIDHQSTSGEYKPSTDVGTETLSRPDLTPALKTEEKLKEDRISDEQKIEMQKESLPEMESDDSKTIPKNDDGIIMKKGYIDKKEAPLNIRDEKEDTSGKNEEKTGNETIAPQEQINQGIDSSEETDRRIKRNKKDSLKTKDKETEKQKDSIEK